MIYWRDLIIGAILGWLVRWLWDRRLWGQRLEQASAVEATMRTQLAQARQEGATWREEARRQAVAYEHAQGQVAEAELQLIAARSELEQARAAEHETQRLRTDLQRAQATQGELAAARDALSARYAEAVRQTAAVQGELELSRAAQRDLGAAHEELSGRFALLRQEADALREELERCQGRVQELNTTRTRLIGRPNHVASSAAPDELERIEGIGPKIAELLHSADIDTFAQLAATPVEQLQAILAAAGPRYRLADPTTWPRQAHLLATNALDELEALQGRLKGGR